MVHSHWSRTYITALSLVESLPSDAYANKLLWNTKYPHLGDILLAPRLLTKQFFGTVLDIEVDQSGYFLEEYDGQVWCQVPAEGGGGGGDQQTECGPQLRTLWLRCPLLPRHRATGIQSRQQHPQSTHLGKVSKREE